MVHFWILLENRWLDIHGMYILRHGKKNCKILEKGLDRFFSGGVN